MVKPETKLAEKPSPFKAPKVAEKIKTAQEELLQLQARRKIVALDSINGVDVAENGAAVKKEVAAKQAEIDELNYQHSVALEADEEYKRKEFADLHRSEIRSVRQHLLARDRAAAALSEALTEAVKQFRLLVDQSQKARASIVLGAYPNMEAFVDFSSIKRLVEMELFRLGGDGGLGNKRSFPGGAAHDLALLNQPEKVVPIATKLSEASEYLINVLTGKAGVE